MDMQNGPEVVMQWEWMRRTFVPLGAIVCATVAELAMRPSEGERASLLVLLSCVWAIAWMSGLRTGLIATGVAGAAALYFVIPPANSFRIGNVSDGVQIALFASQGLLASVFCEMRRRAIAARAEAEIRERAARSSADVASQQYARCRQELKRARADWTMASSAVSRELEGRILAIADSVQEIAKDTSSPELLASLRRERESALLLTEELMTYARAFEKEQGGTIVNIGDLWDQAIANSRTRFARTILLTRGELPDVRAHAATLIEVFEYLIEEVVPFAELGGQVELLVSVGKMPGEWTFSVSDYGTLEAPENLREQAAVRALLRLAICRRLLESQGGRIWTAGRLGDGASFVFSMPRLRSEAVDRRLTSVVRDSRVRRKTRAHN
ncbi:MAG: multi-sensor signal transduction histidine kinase [Bryobacterales bacterium]|nr:multi-sensor signal transduction histidine kinase [Bryobacterales bacterium]